MTEGALALSWSGGKDSALALWTLRRDGREPAALLTTVTESYDRISMHGVRRELLARQAQAAGVPLVEIAIPPACVNDIYDARMAEAFAEPPLRDVDGVAFGDLFLEDIRAYREERLAAAGKRGEFPLWGRDTTVLAREFVSAGFDAFLVCVDPAKLDGSFAGRRYDDVEGEMAQVLDAWRLGFTQEKFPGGESPVLAQHRIRPFVQRVREQARTETVAVVAHGRINRVLIATLTGAGLTRLEEFPQSNACITELAVADDVQVERLNDTAHLGVVGDAFS